MTICMAVICEDGKAAICATDRMVTHHGLSLQFEHAQPKITALTDKCCAMTAGSALSHTDILEQVQGSLAALKDPLIAQAVACIKEAYQQARMEELKEHHLIPRGIRDIAHFLEIQGRLEQLITTTIQYEIDTFDYGVEMIISGLSQDGAHIYGIRNPGVSARFDALGFHAIGSGLPHATNSLIARGCNRDLPLLESLMIVTEAKIMAEKAPGVGPDTDMCIVTLDGCTSVDPTGFDQIRPIYQRWALNDPKWKHELQTFLQDIAEQGKDEQPRTEHPSADRGASEVPGTHAGSNATLPVEGAGATAI